MVVRSDEHSRQLALLIRGGRVRRTIAVSTVYRFASMKTRVRVIDSPGRIGGERGTLGPYGPRA